MNISFLGGGNEIGASSAIVEIGSGRVLVDCGIRMNRADVLPDLEAITKSRLTHLDAVLVTHAHMDHSGALPVLHQHFPSVPIYCTGPTRKLVEVLLRDALNIMRSKAETEGELPLYSKPTVESMLDRMIAVPAGSPLEIGNSGLVATWFPAGHILGAASVGIEGIERGRTRRVLFSGDISAADQITVSGMTAPAGFHPEVLVIESTYGDRLHSGRAIEEQRLLEMVQAVMLGRGKLLIPAFAVGRAQEVILILLREFRAKRLPRFPVYIDGMVRPVCSVYSGFPEDQTPYLQQLIGRHGNPFFNVVDEIRSVAAPTDRDGILAGDRCVIIASSGMLTGGASAYYAKTILADNRNGLAITGYQDEESPGRQLLELAAGQTNHVTIGGAALEVKCSVAKYALSAHADAGEIAALIEMINPRHVVLVHGEGTARPALAEMLRRSGTRKRPIHLPKTGQTLRFDEKRTSAQPLEQREILGGGARLTAEAMPGFAGQLRASAESQRAWSIVELLDLWYGLRSWNEDQYTEVIGLLNASEHFYRRADRPRLYYLSGEGGEVGVKRKGFAEPNQLLQRLVKALGAETGLYRTGYDPANRRLTLTFEFPLVAGERYKEQIEQLLADTGWTFEVSKAVHQKRLAEEAARCLPEGIALLCEPGIHLDRNEVVVSVAAPLPPEAVQAAAARLKEQTGFKLEIKPPSSAASEAPSRGLPRFPPGSRKAMEINAAYRAIDDEFSDTVATSRPYKKSLKSEGRRQFIELSFITPEVGMRDVEKLERLAARIGWPLSIKSEPNQVAMVQVLEDIIPREWGLVGKPSFHIAGRRVRIKCASAPPRDSAEWPTLLERFRELTGYDLKI